MPQMGGSPWVSVVSNPEFLREGAAVRDFMEPRCLVIGGSSAAAVRSRWPRSTPACRCEPSIVALRTAELIKYACNAFHAVKISFANEIGALAGESGHRRRRGDGNPVPRPCAEHLARLPQAGLRLRRLLPRPKISAPHLPRLAPRSQTAAARIRAARQQRPTGPRHRPACWTCRPSASAYSDSHSRRTPTTSRESPVVCCSRR